MIKAGKDQSVDAVFLRIPQESRYMLVLRLMAAGLGNLAAFNSEDIEDLKLAISEACFGKPERESFLDVVFYVEENKVTVEVKNPCLSKRQVLTLDSPTIEGMSFLLMRHLMDSVEFQTHPSETVVRMTKKSMVGNR